MQVLASIADDPFADAFERLFERVQGPERAIANELGVSDYLAVATVVARARPAGRLGISPDQVPDFINAAEALGVHCRVGRVRMLSVPDAMPETRHAGMFITDDHPAAMSLVYFGVTALLAAGAEQADLNGDHRLLAQLFGYPACCAEFYAGSKPEAADRLPASIKSLGPFNRLLNPVSPYVYAAPNLLFHFPCSPDCEASLSLSKQRIAFLSQIEPGFRAFESLGTGLALYGPDVGIGLAAEYKKQDASTFRLHKIVTRSRTTLDLFGTRTEAVIRFESPNAFEIDGRRFSRPDQFGAQFV